MSPRRFIPLFLLAAAIIVTFAPVNSNQFVIYDDPAWIAENPQLQAHSLANLPFFWRHPFEGLYVPLTFSYWALLATISHAPAIFHAGSLALHLLSAMVVYAILKRLFGQVWPACIGAMVFALHPLQAETVAWASGAKDLLAGLLSFVVIWQYMKFAESDRKNERRLHYALSIAALIGAMLAKPSAVVAPFIAAALDIGFVRKDLRKSVLSILPMLVLILPCIIYSRMTQTVWSYADTPLMLRPLIAADAIAFYLYKLVWPISLTIFYGRTPQAVQQSGILWVSWIGPAVLIFVLAFTRNRRAIMAATVFALGLLPVLGLAPFMFQLYSTVADHYIYVAMFGIAILVATIVSAFPNRITYALCGVAIIAMVVRSTLQIRYWQDSVSLMSHAVAVTPDNFNAREYLGLALARAGRVPEAIEHFEFVVDAEPANPHARSYLALALMESGRPKEAEEQLRIAVSLRPDDPALRAQLDSVRRKLDSSTTKP